MQIFFGILHLVFRDVIDLYERGVLRICLSVCSSGVLGAGRVLLVTITATMTATMASVSVSRLLTSFLFLHNMCLGRFLHSQDAVYTDNGSSYGNCSSMVWMASALFAGGLTGLCYETGVRRGLLVSAWHACGGHVRVGLDGWCGKR